MKHISNHVNRPMYSVMCLTLTLLLTCIQAVGGVFETCIYPSDSSGSNQADFILSASEIPCAEQCEDDCTAAFSYVTDYGQVSADLIQECLDSCKNGVTYTNKPRVSSTDFPLWKSGNKELSVFSTCTVFPKTGSGYAMMNADNGTYVIQYDATGNVDNFYYVVNSGLSVMSDKITVKLVGGKYNNGFMCGSDSGYLWPSVGSQGSQNAPGQYSKVGLQTGAPWDSNSSYLSDLNYWNPRNMNWVDLDNSITIQNGDYVSITYAGNYCQSTNCSMDNTPPQTLPPAGSTSLYGYDRGLLMELPDGTSYNFPGNSMNLPSCTTDTDGNITCPDSLCQPSFDNNGNPSCQMDGMLNPSSSTFGLSGLYSVSQVDIDNQGKQPYNIVSFSGILSGFSDDPTNLSFQYNDSILTTSTVVTGSRGCYNSAYPYRSRCQNNLRRVDCCCKDNRNDCGAYGVDSSGLTRSSSISYDSVNQFSDNVGGMVVSVDWKGCYFNQDNISVEYALMPFDSMDSLTVNDYRALSWKKADLNNSFQITGSGVLMFRLTPQGAKRPGDVGGGYDISVKQAPSSITKISSLNAVVQTVNKQLFGSSIGSAKMSDSLFTVAANNDAGNYTNVKVGTPGIVQNIFTYLAQEPTFISAIRAALLLYMAYTGFSFMVGISPINQKEALTILIKIGVILILISGNSWGFFNTYIFKFLIQGSADLMSVMTMNYDEYNIVNTGSNAVNLFSFLDPILSQLFSNTIWVKVLALFFSGISAWFPTIILLISIVLFILFLFRVVMLYLTSMIALSILTIVAPIFLSFMLFQYTHSMFVGWLKQYISFAIQPILVVTLASIMAKLITFLLNTNLYFTVCKTCIIGWRFHGKSFCLLPTYMSLPGLFGIDVGSIHSPILSFESLMVLYLVVNAANVLCSHLSGLAAEIVTGSMISLNLANASPSNPIEMYNNLKGMIGMNDSAVSLRTGLMNTFMPSDNTTTQRPPVVTPGLNTNNLSPQPQPGGGQQTPQTNSVNTIPSGNIQNTQSTQTNVPNPLQTENKNQNNNILSTISNAIITPTTPVPNSKTNIDNKKKRKEGDN